MTPEKPTPTTITSVSTVGVETAPIDSLWIMYLSRLHGRETLPALEIVSISNIASEDASLVTDTIVVNGLLAAPYLPVKRAKIVETRLLATKISQSTI